MCRSILTLFSANFTKWSSTLKQFVGNLLTNCLSAFDHFVGLALKGLMKGLTFNIIAFAQRRSRIKCSSLNLGLLVGLNEKQVVAVVVFISSHF